MGKKIITPEQAARMLLDYEMGESGKELAARYGVTPAAVSWWAQRYTGLSSKWIRHVRALEHHNALMITRVHNLTRDIFVGAEIIARMQPNARRRAVLGIAIRAEFRISQVSANRIVGLCRTAGTGKGLPAVDGKVIGDMKRYFEQNPGQGFDKVFDAILKGLPETRRQCKKVYKLAKLDVGLRERKSAVPRRISKPMVTQSALNDMWSMDFLTHFLSNGRRFYVLNAIDDFNREAVVTAITSKRSARFVVECLARAVADGRVPRCLRTDNGGEFKARDYIDWAKRANVERVYSRPHTPTDNVFVERFNRTMRQEIFDRYHLRSLAEASRMVEDWSARYNLSRPHSSLGGLSPLQFSKLVGVKASIRTV